MKDDKTRPFPQTGREKDPVKWKFKITFSNKQLSNIWKQIKESFKK